MRTQQNQCRFFTGMAQSSQQNYDISSWYSSGGIMCSVYCHCTIRFKPSLIASSASGHCCTAKLTLKIISQYV